MAGDEDDDALTWEGARDPSHYETPIAKPVKAPAPSTSSGTEVTEPVEQGPGTLNTVASSALLISLGVFVGVYALYTVGWFVSWQRFTYASTDQLEQSAFTVEQLLAIVAPIAWFATVILLTRNRRPALRLVWLLIGALVLIPWPFTLGQ
jgi:hypothetical protein